MSVVAAADDPSLHLGGHGAVVTGTLVGLALSDRTPLITYPGIPDSAAVPARTIVDLSADHVGQQVVVVFERGDVSRPIIMGRIRNADGGHRCEPLEGVRVDVDEDRLVISAKQQIVLQCGRASITLTRAGKILLKGAYVSTSSTGINRIRGAAIQLN
jgi:hypothetical protein